jgi:hypothetical protein
MKVESLSKWFDLHNFIIMEEKRNPSLLFFYFQILLLPFFFVELETVTSYAQTITIDVSKPGHVISSALYNGMLFEEINYGIDGGFYAQLIRNGSFEDMNNEDSSLDAWSVVSPGKSDGHLTIETGDEKPHSGSVKRDGKTNSINHLTGCKMLILRM